MKLVAPVRRSELHAANAGPVVVEARGVGMVYDNGLPALQGVDLTVREGEFVTLLGPSGCGKSTLLRMAAGLAQPTHGQLSTSANARRAFVFQEPTLMPWGTVFQNVSLPLTLARTPPDGIRQRVAQVLDLVGLRGFEAAYPRELSGGMQMRVSIARALVTTPDLLLLDEPFAALDEINRNRLNAELLNLWALKRWTVLFVTHSIYEAVYLSTRVVVMSARPGRIVDELGIAEGYPRTQAFRTTTRFAELCSRLASSLDKASAELK
jgi:NitT/TauT family transport system ATP-binding protein